MTLIAIFLAVLLDWLIGDPYSWPHPVKWMGFYIYLCMRLQEKRQFSFLCHRKVPPSPLPGSRCS